MPIIKLWCLPKVDEEKLRQVHQAVVAACVGVKEMGFGGEKDMTVLFPPDMMLYWLGSEIVVEVTGLFKKPERTVEVRQKLAEAVGEAVATEFPTVGQVEVFIYPFDPQTSGFWSSM
jgi:hypothetical protein